jgi:hypothetical protein
LRDKPDRLAVRRSRPEAHDAVGNKKRETLVLRLIVGFLPWIILGTLGEQWFVLSLVLGLIAAAVTTFRQYRRGAPKILDTVTLAFFALIFVGVVGFQRMVLATYMSVLVNTTLAAIALGSLLAGTPFTIQYAREQVAPEFWHKPGFLRVNQYITAAWGLNFVLAALVSGYRHLSGDASLVWKYAWVALSLLAVLFTAYFPGWYRSHALRGTPQSEPTRPQ